MNESHKIGKKRNRLNRCRKRLSSKELTSMQRIALEQRASELETELNRIK
ncbi:MAG TPA: hypothetical protein PL028_05830 [Bacteroidales bacterium]|jgi:hypothetical protein|nr:hypothetical protein [Bacteroidales bacterium]